MSCQPYHDDDFFEKYILDRLSGTEKTDFEKHLLQCNACRQEVALQRSSIAGLRAAGREKMKQEIREQVARSPHAAVNWMRLARIAAVFFLFIITPSVYFLLRETDTLNQSEAIPPTQLLPAPVLSKAGDQNVSHFPKPNVSDVEVKEEVSSKTQLREMPAKINSAKGVASRKKDAIQRSPAAVRDRAEPQETHEREALNVSPMLTLSSGNTPLAKQSYYFSHHSVKEDSLVFAANGDTVLVRINPRSKIDVKNTTPLPPEFPVQITKLDSSKIEMVWFISNALLKSRIQLSALQQMSGKKMQLVLPEGRVYQINLQADSTRAVLVR